MIEREEGPGEVELFVASATPEEIARRIMVAEIIAEQRRQQVEYIREQVRGHLDRPDPMGAVAETWRDLAARMLEDMERMEPYAMRGQDADDNLRTMRAKAAKRRLGQTQADPNSVRHDVAELMQNYPAMSRSEACKRIAFQYGISLSTALRYTRE